MRPFAVASARSTRDAVQRLAGSPEAKFIAGGTTLLDLMKSHIETPAALIDLTRLDTRGIEVTAEGLRIGATTRMNDVAEHPVVRSTFPGLAESLWMGASAGLRNLATIGGNLLQRTRCAYFRNPDEPSCNKRRPGSGCAALEGDNRYNAILGGSDACIATHASDLCVALAALDAVVHVEGPSEARSIALVDLHAEPGVTPWRETVLERDELITQVTVPHGPHTRGSAYLKVRDRHSYAFALTSAFAALALGEDGRVVDARVALGGVATRPWRAWSTEDGLRGGLPTADAFADAARRVVEGATPRARNGFKVELAPRVVTRALELARQRASGEVDAAALAPHSR